MKKKTTLRTVAATLTAGAAMTLFAPAAFAANPSPAEGAVTASNLAGDASFGPGWNDVINGHAAASRNMVIEGGDTVAVYCVQEGIDFNGSTDAVFSALTWANSGIPNAAKAAGIAVNSKTLGTPLEDARSEGAATQLAIWKYTNNLDFSVVQNAAIVNRANELVAAAPDAPEGISSFVLKGSTALEGENNVVTATLTGNGAALADSTITLDLPGDNDPTAKTDAAGVATFTVPATDAEVSGTLVYKGILSKGSILAPTDGQIVVTVSDANITRTAPVTLAPKAVTPVTPPPTEEPTPSTPPVEQPPAPPAPPADPPAQPAAPPADARPAELPYTGTWVTGGVLALAVAAIAGGFGIRRYLASR